MSAEAAAPPPPAAIGPRQRLNATAVLSLLVHGVLILGLGFALKGEAPRGPTLDVIFCQTRTELNVTSPTCIRELDEQFGLNIAGLLFDAIEARVASAPAA